jgi:hypothetical protein
MMAIGCKVFECANAEVAGKLQLCNTKQIIWLPSRDTLTLYLHGTLCIVWIKVVDVKSSQTKS